MYKKWKENMWYICDKYGFVRHYDHECKFAMPISNSIRTDFGVEVTVNYDFSNRITIYRHRLFLTDRLF